MADEKPGQVRARLAIIEAERVLLTEALERVKGLHRPIHWHIGRTSETDRWAFGESCDEPGDCWAPTCRHCGGGSQWPCATRLVLDGREAT